MFSLISVISESDSKYYSHYPAHACVCWNVVQLEAYYGNKVKTSTCLDWSKYASAQAALIASIEVLGT